jgi:hypothetical protein
LKTLKQNIEHPLEISIDTTLKTLKNSPNNRVGLWVWLCELRSFDLARLAGFMNERWKLRFFDLGFWEMEMGMEEDGDFGSLFCLF